MNGVVPAARAWEISWLRPASVTLLALADESPDTAIVGSDPAMLAHLVRSLRPALGPGESILAPSVLTDPEVCDQAATFLESVPELPEYRAIDRVDLVADSAGRIARELAENCRAPSLCHPDAAAVAARLAPLGWYILGAVAPRLRAECLADPELPLDPIAVQRRRWGMAADQIARRAATRWRFPQWLAVTIGSLRLAADDAVDAGAPETLFRIVRAALLAAEKREGILGLVEGRTLEDADPFLHQAAAIAARDSFVRDHLDLSRSEGDQPSTRILAKLLRTAARARQTDAPMFLAEAEARIDRLTDSLANLRATFSHDLRDAKLAGLAEFAAGASHEINNPMAVISGRAQLLATHETDPERLNQLQAIIKQTKRVHQLLQGTLQFARPPRPKSTLVSLPVWLADVVRAHQADAQEKSVVLELADDSLPPAFVRIDPKQIGTALDQLIRNAIEAARGGRVRVTLEEESGLPAIIVEDSGPGPAPEQMEHLFDPFYSGRSAGRGAGLGLSIAWRLARVNGGDIRFQRDAEGPTRFRLVLPRAEPQHVPRRERRSA